MRKYIDIINEAPILNPKDFPNVIEHEGVRYYRTDKLGYTVDTGEPSAQYQTAPRFIWRTKSGKITPD